jgi:CHAT domain-containing protein/Tfp pilus assembly protein PilF
MRLRGIALRTILLTLCGGAYFAGAVTRSSAPDDSAEATGLLTEVRLQIDRGEYASAEARAREVLAFMTERYGPRSLESARAGDLLMEALLESGEYRTPETRETGEIALAIKEALLGDADPEVATTLVLLGEVHRRSGDNGTALRLFERSRQIRVEALPEGHSDIAESLYYMALIATARGDFITARRLFDEALLIYSKQLGPEHAKVGLVRNNLATMLYWRGDWMEARAQFERALAIREKALGPDHPHVAGTLNNYGILLHDMRDLDGARAAFERAIRIREERLGSDHHRLGTTLNNLGRVLQDLGDLDGAEIYLSRALVIDEKRLGEDHFMVSASHDSLGALLYAKGDIAGARERFERALAIRRKALGPHHPDMAFVLNNLARALAAAGETAAAIDMALETEKITGEHLRLTMHALSEREALSYAAVRMTGLDLTLSLVNEATEEATKRRVWNAMIGCRAIVLDEMANRYRFIGRIDDPETERLATELGKARTALARLLVKGPDPEHLEEYARQETSARRKREKAERALAERSMEFRELFDRSRTDLDDVSAALPAGSSLVAFYTYKRSVFGEDRNREPTEWYVAFVLRSEQRDPEVVQLGEASRIEPLIASWLEKVAEPPQQIGAAQAAAEEAAREMGLRVRGAIWEPLEEVLDGAERVFVVPDGALHLVNLGVLPGREGSYLIESGPVIHYLGAERDLLVPEMSEEGNRGLFLLGDPEFDRTADTGHVGAGIPTPATVGSPANDRKPPPAAGQKSASDVAMRSGCGYFRAMRFRRSPETAREARRIADLWRERSDDDADAVLMLSGARATERAFKRRAPGHRVIHLATHGFFLGGHCRTVNPHGRGVGKLAGDGGSDAPAVDPESPLLMSGLVLAGANHRDEVEPGEEDGILTAEEIAAANLSGVEWAVLSACHTGLGKIEAGEGVFGLRRAFQIAGARTLIMSLWSVEDRATADWMERLYEGRLAGLSTADAVHQASTGMIRERREGGVGTHPFFWGAFVASGGWR